LNTNPTPAPTSRETSSSNTYRSLGLTLIVGKGRKRQLRRLLESVSLKHNAKPLFDQVVAVVTHLDSDVEDVLEEFKGDASRHVDAETFFNRGQEVMPILKAQNKALERRLAAMEKDMKRASEFFSKSEERGYQRALAEIKQRQEAAVETGDVAAFRAADQDAEKLRAEMDTSKAPVDEVSPEQRAEEFADWGKANKWYATNSVMAAYADSRRNR